MVPGKEAKMKYRIEGKLVAYLSGPITGIADYRSRFAEAERRLSKYGYIVLNPAVLPAGMDAQDYMQIDFAMIDAADFVILLPGHEESLGSRLEKAYAEYVAKEVHEIDDFLCGPAKEAAQ